MFRFRHKKIAQEAVELSTGSKITLARQQAEQSMRMFQDAHDALEEANEVLADAKEQATREREVILEQLALVDRHIKNINDDTNANKGLQEQIKPFILRV